MAGEFDELQRRLNRLYEQEAQVRSKRQDARAVLSKCIAGGHLTAVQAARIEYDINLVEAAEAQHMAKAAVPARRPSLGEVIRHGWFSEIAPARHQPS